MTEQQLKNQDAIRRIAAKMKLMPQAITERLDVFAPGVYVRNLKMPAGNCFVSELHKTQHLYNIFHGKMQIWTPETGEWVSYKGPGGGTTMPGTQRLFLIEETVWIQTIHPTNVVPVDNTKEAYEAAEREIFDAIIEKVDYSAYLPSPLNAVVGKKLSSSKYKVSREEVTI